MAWNPLAGPLADFWATLTSPYEVAVTDMSANLTVNFNALQAVVVAQPLGYTGSLKTTGSGNYSTAATVVSSTLTYVAGRQYFIAAYFQGIQNTSTGIVNVGLGGTGITPNIAFLGSVAAGQTAYGSTWDLFSPSSSGVTVPALVASTSAGTITIATGATIVVVDLGT